MDSCEARITLESYAASKNEHDVERALACCGDDFQMVSSPLGVVVQGREQAASVLANLFRVFPSWAATTSGMAFSDQCTDGTLRAVVWGELAVTMAGSFGRLAATGRSAAVPYVTAFDLRSGLIRREEVHWSLGELCEQLDLDLSAVWRQSREKPTRMTAIGDRIR